MLNERPVGFSCTFLNFAFPLRHLNYLSLRFARGRGTMEGKKKSGILCVQRKREQERDGRIA